MSKVLVIKNEDLLNIGNGYTEIDDRLFKVIIQESFWADRGLAEKDFSLRQIIVYSTFICPSQGKEKVFLFRRAPGKQYDEKRLRNKWSCGLGGHISQEKDGVASPLFSSFFRELREEVGFEAETYRFDPIGFLCDNGDEVGRVHLGLLNIVEILYFEPTIIPIDPEIAEGRMMPLSEAEAILNDPNNEPEGWTKIAFPIIKKRLS